MAKCSMMVYEPADKVPDGEYWKRYINFYEKFWDRPAGPKSVWWGAEYNEFRRALAASLEIKAEEVRDCFFTKGDGGHLICRIDDPATLGIVSCENFIPFEWLAAFDGEKRDFFYTHTGFGAVHHDSIYYVENIATAMERIEAARGALENLEESVSKYPELARIKDLPERLSEMNAWLRGFDAGGEIVLNYGEICSHITQDSMKNENSVSDLKRIIAGIGSEDFEQAESGLKYLNAKWAEIAEAINRSGKQKPAEKPETEN
ncbi:MAG: hypothetical protein OXF45_05295 [Candidatus Dadabacteria bacterium]|nr:hypothetical protein [Candidatus Dadabacteria bacterium]